MRLSLQVQYAICGLFDIAYNGQGSSVQVRRIGERQQIPTRYLEQIFQRLRRARLVNGKRGPGGGYALARPASDIDLREVVEAVEGSLTETGAWGDAPADAAQNQPGFLWPEIAEGFARVLSQTTLEKLCIKAAQAAVPQSNAAAYTYQI